MNKRLVAENDPAILLTHDPDEELTFSKLAITR